jgi:hypothetical protein
MAKARAAKSWDGTERRTSGIVDRRGDPRTLTPFQEYPKHINGKLVESPEHEARLSGKTSRAAKATKTTTARTGRKK